jgi:putative endonuclease
MGYALLQMNYRTRFGEIDLIVRDGQTLVFVEVKSLVANLGFDPMERVTAKKQERIRKVALHYLLETGQYESCPVRFDVISWKRQGEKDVFQHIVNAF